MMFQHYSEQLQHYHLFKPFILSLHTSIIYLAAIWKQFQPSLLVSVKLAPLCANTLMISKFNLVHDSIRGVLHWQINQQCIIKILIKFHVRHLLNMLLSTIENKTMSSSCPCDVKEKPQRKYATLESSLP